jgi:hypothetical protein
MPRGKAAAERKHAKRRMVERFGIPVGDETLRQAVLDIQQGRAKPIRKQSLRVTLFELMIHDILVRVAYDKNTKEIITILRPGDESQY